MAESFGVDPRRYDRARPTYPQSVVERILTASPGRTVLDVGCGTGIVARQLRAAGCVVLGVEPDPRMARVATASGVAVEIAAFETWDPAGRTIDAVVSGTAWHWVDPVAGATKAAQVLGAGGVLAPFGSVYQLPPPLAEALAAAYRRAAPDSPLAAGRRSDGSLLDAYQGLYLTAAEGIRAAGGFDEPELWRDDWERTYARDELLELVRTSGGLTSLDPGQADRVLATVAGAAAELGDTVTLPYATWGLTAVRRLTAPGPPH